MSNDLTFYQQLMDVLEERPVTIATVIQTVGSVPREVGARLMVWTNKKTDELNRGPANLHTFGTIGGGAGEAKVLQQAKNVLATGQHQQVTIDLSGAADREIQGICGGQMQVWIERWQGEDAIALTQQILHHLTQGQTITLSFLIGDLEDSVSMGSQNQPLPCIVDPETTPSPHSYHITLQPPPTLLIVGAGHCGIPLAKVAALSGFQVMVHDDRPQWANAQNFPDATRLFHGAIAQVATELAHHPQLYVTLVTRGFDHDLPVLKALLQRPSPCRYIGMMGSQKRIQTVLQAIQRDIIQSTTIYQNNTIQNNIFPQNLQNLHAPIGLDIGALTPEEIAVSICAELIMVRRGETRTALSSLRTPIPQ